MKPNRRNYYRVLHVQPEAPAEVIKASYRALMLRAHPDRGGTHHDAALINEAYAVLSDPVKRAAYDRTLNQARSLKDRFGTTAAHKPAPDATFWRSERRCPLCRHPLPATLAPDASCARCEAPLTLPPANQGKRELIGRRANPRHARDHAVLLFPGWQTQPLNARVRNVSLTGTRLLVAAPLTVHQVVRIIDPHFDAVAVVVACRRQAQHYSLHAHFLTLRPTRRAGGFVSARA